MNNKGKSTALVIILILIVALVVAYLAMTQMGNLGFNKKQEGQTQSQNLINMSDEDLLQQAKDLIDSINTSDQDIVQQAQDIVNQLNQAQQNAAMEP